MATHGDRNILNSILNPLLPLGEFNEEDELPEVNGKINVETATIKPRYESHHRFFWKLFIRPYCSSHLLYC